MATGPRPRSVTVDRLGVSVGLDGRTWPTDGVTWKPWTSVRYAERTKPGVDVLAQVYRDLAP